MSEEKVFVDGLIVKRHEKSPDFVICNLSFKGQEFLTFMREHQKDGWVNVQVKRSKGGKLYAELDTFTPGKREEYDSGMQQARQAAEPAGDGFDDSIPF